MSDLPPLRDGETQFGTFYPKNYVLAFVADDATAHRAEAALRDAGFGADDVIVAAGREVVANDAALHQEAGVVDRLRALWSRLYTDEAADVDGFLTLARAGAAAVLVYAPDDDRTARAADALRPFAPTVLRKYGAFTVTDLA